jgi:hypothetical protein
MAFVRLRGTETTGLYMAKNICPEGLFLVHKVFPWAFNGSNMKVTLCGAVKRSCILAKLDDMAGFIGEAGSFIAEVEGLTLVDRSGNLFSFLPVMEVEHCFRPAHVREKDGRKFTEESTVRVTFSRAFISSTTGDVNIPLDWKNNKLVKRYFKPTPLKLACLKLQVFLLVCARTTGVKFSAEVKAAKIAFYLTAINTRLPAQHPHEAEYLEEVLDDLPLGTPKPVFLEHLEMNTFALLQEEDQVVVVRLLSTRAPSVTECIGCVHEEGHPHTLQMETVSVHEYHRLSHGIWIPCWGLKGQIVYSKQKPSGHATVPERWVFPESLAMLDVVLTSGGRLPAAVVREYANFLPDLPVW